MAETGTKQLIHPRISQSAYDALLNFARGTHRSISGAVDHILEMYLIADHPLLAGDQPDQDESAR